MKFLKLVLITLSVILLCSEVCSHRNQHKRAHHRKHRVGHSTGSAENAAQNTTATNTTATSSCTVKSMEEIGRDKTMTNNIDRELVLSRSLLKSYLIAIGYTDTDICPCVEIIGKGDAQKAVKYFSKMGKKYKSKYARKIAKAFGTNCKSVSKDDIKKKVKDQAAIINALLSVNGRYIAPPTPVAPQDPEEVTPDSDDKVDDATDEAEAATKTARRRRRRRML
jgi:hypothetical protein